MTNSGKKECSDVNKNVVRPTFLPLSLKRAQFYPTLPMTPEHEACYERSMGITDCDVINWDLLASQRFAIDKRFEDDDAVFPESPRKPRKNSCEKASSLPNSPIAGKKAKCKTANSKTAKLSDLWRVDEEKDEGKCCSRWLRAYLRRLWVKAPQESSPTHQPQRLRQPTILEREFSQKPRSPRVIKRTTKKHRHSATSSFVYSAFFEDSVKELREERHGDVIYAITVKKDTLPRNSAPLKSPSSGDVMMEKNTSRHLKGATLDHIIERLARVFVEGGEDANFLNVFLTTYRTFASPEELFTKLSDEYAKVKDESPTKNAVILRSIVRVLRAWLERYSQDDFLDMTGHQLLRRLLALAKEHDEFVNGANDVISPRRSPLPQRKNGFVAGAGFADYVAAKLAVAVKQDRVDKALASSLPSPTHSQDPRLDVTLEGTELNLEPATQLLYGLSSRYLAAQLTVIDAKLFHQVQPHHCLAAVASSKNRPATVQATIDQFNRVVYCVMATVLCPGVKLAQRTKILSRWIEVAQECRELKNFSSLRAIVSGLQTYAIHRLKKAWVNVPHSHANLLKELTELNMKDLLMKVGTAKVNTEDSSITRVRKDAAIRRHQDMHSGIVHGTVPYLGSFLTDLTYLDTARPDFLEGGLINFEKRREEFELLAQLQLLQASCRSYQHLEPDPLFLEWFQSYTVLTDDQTFKLSEMIEPPASSVSSPAVHTSPLKRSISDKLFSIPYGRGESDSESTGAANGLKSAKKQENGGPKFSQSFNGRIGTPSPGAQSRIVKVRLVRNHAKLEEGVDGKDRNSKDDFAKKDDLSSTCEYKTITISSNERTAAVIRKSLDLFMLDVEANAKRFSLVQILHDTHKEILIPDSANVFYAMSSSDLEPTLVLLEEGAEIATKIKRHQSTPHKAKKNRHRKNHSLSYIRDSESSPGRAASPMKSFYQIALGSVALVGGSYSPSMAARRSSDGEDGSERGSSSGSVVLLNKSGLDEGSRGGEMKAWHQKVRQMRASMSDASHLDLQGAEGVTGNRSYRCFSADYSSTVVLPVKVIRPRKALSSTEISPSKSAPCSPESQRRGVKGAKVEFSEVPPRIADCHVITATGTLIEWPRYSTSVYGSRSATWSSRRAIRRSKKPLPKSRFYTRETALKSYEDEVKRDKSEGASRSKFYVDIELEGRRDVTSPLGRSTKTLPSGFSPDFSGHDYEDRTYRNSVSLDSDSKALPTPVPLSQWELPKRKLDSFASLSSNQSADAASSDSGSCISFVASPPEDNVFDDDVRNHGGKSHDVTPTSPSSLSNDFATKVAVSPKRGQLDVTPPLIKIQCASPEGYRSPTPTPRPDESPSSDTECENAGFHSVAQDSDQETSTYL